MRARRALGAWIGIWMGGAVGWAWSADDIVRIGEVPSGTLRLGRTPSAAIRLGPPPPSAASVYRARTPAPPPPPPDAGTRKTGSTPTSANAGSDSRSATPVAVFRLHPRLENTAQDFQLDSGMVLRKARFQRLPDGWFRIQHQAGLGTYHILEFIEKDRLRLAAWRPRELSTWEWDPETLRLISGAELNRRRLDFTLIPEIELTDAPLPEIIEFMKTYYADRDTERKRLNIELQTWDENQRISLPTLRYVSLSQLLKHVVREADLTVEIGDEAVIVRDAGQE